MVLVSIYLHFTFNILHLKFSTLYDFKEKHLILSKNIIVLYNKMQNKSIKIQNTNTNTNEKIEVDKIHRFTPRINSGAFFSQDLV